MVNPDGVQRKLVGEVIGRLEKKGLQMVAMKMMQIEPELAARHYGEHRGKPFYESLISFITSGPVVAMVWEGGECSLCIPGVNRCHRPHRRPLPAQSGGTWLSLPETTLFMARTRWRVPGVRSVSFLKIQSSAVTGWLWMAGFTAFNKIIKHGKAEKSAFFFLRRFF